MSDFPPPTAPQPTEGRFSLRHLFYAMTLLGVGLGVGHIAGLVLAVFVLIAWFFIFWIAENSRTALGWTLLLFGALFGLAIVNEAVTDPREHSRRAQSGNNLKQIGLALHAYLAAHSTMPPAYLADAQGQPAHSWRVLILPHIDQGGLLQRYHFSEPWDGPNNVQLASMMPSELASMTHYHSARTPYKPVVGPGTLFEGEQGRTLAEWPRRRQVILIEEAVPTTLWSEPKDLTLAEALSLLTNPAAPVPHSYDSPWGDMSYRGRHVGWSDGSVTFVHPGLAREEAEEMLGLRPPSPRVSPPPSIDYSRWLRAGLFLFTALFPFPWALRSTGL